MSRPHLLCGGIGAKPAVKVAGPGLPSLVLTHLYKVAWHKAVSAEPPIATVTMTPLPTVAGRAGCVGGCHTVAMQLPFGGEGTRKRVPRLRPGGWPPILSPLPH